MPELPASVLRVAAVQMSSGQDVDTNLAAAASLISGAAEAGAQWIALPEMFAYLRREGEAFPCAQTLDDGIVAFVKDRARAHGVWLLGGSFPERASAERVYNTSVLVDPRGELSGVYRKMHLFDVDLRKQGGAIYQESKSIAPGEEPVCVETPFGRVGLSVCYDVRFPELYRLYADREARFLTVPAAFAPQTGRDHWELLLRARAVENLCFVVAPAQVGAHSPDRSSYGRSMVVDPWGLILAQASDRPGFILADCDLASQDRIRESLPCLGNRRL